jgi:hypothetical protein
VIRSFLSSLVFTGVLFPTYVLAGQCTSVGNGGWGSAGTWDCGHVPTGGDTITILAGHTVSVTQNYVYSGAPLHVYVYGVWYFSGGGSKITLPCGSFVEIMPGGQLMPNSNSGGHSETVRICGVTYWYFDQGAQSGYQIWPYATPLPVELISFDAAVTGSSVMLHWATATERGSDRFEVYVGKGPDALELLTLLPARGNSTTTTEYAYLDPARKAGLWYYGLKEVDADGTVSDQGMVAVLVRDQRKDITCTPTDGHLLILSEDMGNSAVQINGIDGRTHAVADVVMTDRNMMMLNLSNLKHGVYFAPVMDNAGRSSCSFVIE